MRIACPWCGLRDHAEFFYGGPGDRVRPAPDEERAGPWFDHLYAHDNPRGAHRELWQHAYGCRSWLLVTRDTLTHEVLDVAPARGGPP